ncbi:hypothetical protein J8F10_34580 [Gemmata sp. G18]|uniref:Uncharacterized protein n=1 Tax=Gemmata palustris TaxID=2822762 RepID=A0ABS5C330_9BACT|nr:hypothetical protein [Gemmata palustris]MBP3960382.1 hypothetical protein [Gemmata palustris]
MKQLLAVVAAVALVGTSTGDEKVAFETILKTHSGGPKKAAEVVIRSEKERKAFTETCSSENTRKFLDAVKVDFDKEVLVAVAVGPSGSVLTKTEMKQTGVQKVTSGDEVVVEYCVVTTDVQCEPNYPLYVVRIPKATTVAFKKTEKTIGG